MTAYLMKALEVDYRQVETEYDAKVREPKKAVSQQKLKDQLQEKERQKLRATFKKEKMAAISKLLGTLDESVIGTVKKKFLESIENNPLLSKILESKGFEAAAIQSHWQKYLAQKYLPAEIWNFDAFLERKKTGI